MNIDGITLHALVCEIDNEIQGARIDRITQPDKMTIVLSIRQPGRNLTLTLSAEPDQSCRTARLLYAFTQASGRKPYCQS